MIAAPLLLAAAFLHERTIVPGAKGPNRLTPDAGCLTGAAPLRYAADGRRVEGGLEDLRLYDRQGAEVPYLLLMPRETEAQWEPANILPVTATKTTSGFEADLGDRHDVDRVRITGIDPPFLKRVRLEGSGDREHWTLLADEATIFDLPDQQLHEHEIGFTAGQYRYLRVTWDDRNSARVKSVGSVAARLHDAPAADAVRVPITFARKIAEAGKSRYRLSLPGEHLPVAAIELLVRNADVFRDATVTSPRDGQVLGSATLRRTTRDGITAAQMFVPIAFPPSPELDLAVDDGSNPPLDIVEADARLAPLPTIYFDSPDGAPITARYGDPRAGAAHYDLEASRQFAMRGAAATAHWSGATTEVTRQATEPELPLAGGVIDPADFRVSRAIPDAKGLVSLQLDLDVLSRARSDRGDIRIIDQTGRQVPYIIEAKDHPLTLRLVLPPLRAQDRTSIYRLELPYEQLPAGTQLRLTAAPGVFERAVTVKVPVDEKHGREEQTLSTMTWRTDASAASPPALTWDVDCQCKALEIVIDEGDNSPLALTGAELIAPAAALRFYHPGTPLTLLYGSRTVPGPRYDLALVAQRILDEPAKELVLTAPAKEQARDQGVWQQRLFWGAIIIAVILLLFVLARLIRAQIPPAGAAAD